MKNIAWQDQRPTMSAFKEDMFNMPVRGKYLHEYAYKTQKHNMNIIKDIPQYHI